MKQRDLSKAMQQASGFKSIDYSNDNILQFFLKHQHTPNILSDLAENLGNLFLADACIVVVAKVNSPNANAIGHWQGENALSITPENMENLSYISLNQDSYLQSGVIDRTSSKLSEKIDRLLQKIFPHKTWLGLTTQYQQQINGLILLLKSNFSEGHDSEHELLAKISDSMAIAISQVQLQQQTQTQTKYQSLLKNISRKISQSSHPQSLFKTCLAEICTAFQADRGLIVMLKYKNPLRAKHRQQQFVKGTARITSYWSSESADLTSQEQGELSFSLSDSDLCQKAWHSAPRYLCFKSGVSFPDLIGEQTTDLLQADGSALLMMPLMGKKSSDKDPAAVLGFLVVQHNSAYHWLEDEIDLIDWVGIQLSTAIINHQNLSQVQSIVKEQTVQLKWSLDVQAKLSTRMRQQIEQLQKLNQLKDDFMNSMSHELKTPLTSMKMAIMMLRQASISPEMREKYLNILEQEWNREYDLIKDLLTLQSMESGELNYSPEELDLSQTIDNLAQSFTSKWQPEKGIKLKTNIPDSGLKINTDVESLDHILTELLLNAAKYSDNDTVVELSAESKTTFQGKDIVISVANTGAEITPEELPHIFDKFRRGIGVTDRAVPGTGLGLALVQYLVEHLNGTIEVTNKPSDDTLTNHITTFILKLPQFQPSIS